MRASVLTAMLLAGAALAALAAAADTATDTGPSGGAGAAVSDYDACLALVEHDPAAAEVAAERWERTGGGAAASHCRAQALAATGPSRVAAVLLTDLAESEPGIPDASRAEMFVQAGELWLEVGQTGSAAAAADQALRLVPGAWAAMVLRARIRAAEGDSTGAIQDLTDALAAAPSAPTYALRAGAWRRRGDAARGRADAEAAIALDPGHAPAWLEKGAAEAALGMKGEARISFLEAIARDPDGSTVRLARLALQKMEAGVE